MREEPVRPRLRRHRGKPAVAQHELIGQRREHRQLRRVERIHDAVRVLRRIALTPRVVGDEAAVGGNGWIGDDDAREQLFVDVEQRVRRVDRQVTHISGVARRRGDR